MQSSVRYRFVAAALLVVALAIGVSAPGFAQEATLEPTSAFTSPMMMMESSCPQNIASTLVEQLTAMQMEGDGMAATEEAGMEATEEGMGMDMTATPMMEAAEESMMGPHCFVGSFSGSAEVPGPGDEEGLGLAFVTIDPSTGEVCYEIAVANITLPAQAMHIHMGAEDESGGVVIPFPTAPDAEGQAMGCTMAEDMTVVEDIASNPEGYYVNVHTSDYPDGAVRAQLMDLEEGRNEMQDMGLNWFDMRGDTAP
ncbi:MAG: CHRD domain-containing protein [Chloroflexi bacterium]|nr:CHRD domain-containing protein [Chloroflexota bacterium]